MEIFTHFTPLAEELLPNHKIKCVQPNCDSTFTNTGNYEMHLKRHHKISASLIESKKTYRLFYCPEPNCIYNMARQEGKHFKNLKYLRQHYQKVHAEKIHSCDRCDKKFSTVGQLASHREKVCGKRFVCKVCGWSYESMEALLVHCKRKKHIVIDADPVKESTKGKSKPKRAAPESKYNQNKQTQTEAQTSSKRLCMISVQTDPPILSPLAIPIPTQISNIDHHVNTTNDDLDDIHSLLRDIETQTELPHSYSTSSSTSTHTSTNSGFLVQMLGQSTHTHTQTCDDFLSEFGLNVCQATQTQTNWSSFSGTEDDKHQYASAATSTRFAHDELLVSTETQTSFTQCLLDSCTAPRDTEEEGFGNIYITQHTQTCDTLLEGLFGSQENDLIGSFQSTYTQT